MNSAAQPPIRDFVRSVILRLRPRTRTFPDGRSARAEKQGLAGLLRMVERSEFRRALIQHDLTAESDAAIDRF